MNENEPLTNPERVIYEANRHWAILCGPVLLTALGWLSLGSPGYSGIALIVFGVVWGIFSYVTLRDTEIVLTDKEIRIKPGVPWQKTRHVGLRDIIAVDYYQPSLGSMLNFGKLIIVDKGRKRYFYRFVSSPADFVQQARKTLVDLNPTEDNS